MPRKVRLTPAQERDRIINQYQREKNKIKNPDVKQALLDIEHNKFGAMIFLDPLFEAAETYALWKSEGKV